LHLDLDEETAMNKIACLTAMLAGAMALGGCASVGEEMGWRHDHAVPTEVQVASCDAATSTLKGKPDHDISQRACVDAKARQGVD